MKKIFTAILVCTIVASGALMLTGCDKEGKGTEVYKAYEQVMTEMKTDTTTPFENDNRNDINSNYFLNSFTKKVDVIGGAGLFVDYGQQDEMIALALNYIDKYYPLTQNYKSKKNIQTIVDKVSALKSSYSALTKEYQNLLQLSSFESETIYNGFMARYAESARKFSIKAYDAAQALSKYLSKNVKVDASVGKDDMTDEAKEFYLDSRILEIYDDYNNLIMINGKGLVGEMPTKFSDLSNIDYTKISVEETQSLMAIFNALNAERRLSNKALNRFSYYDYTVVYNKDVAAYEKTVDYAQLYLQEIDRYYLDTNSYINLTYKAIKDKI